MKKITRTMSTNCKWNKKTGWLTLAFLVAGIITTPIVIAGEKNIGNHSQDEIKSACNAAGGELLGVSESGSYGCEVASKGTMILCNKSGSCTGYTPAQTRPKRKMVLDSLKLKSK